MSPDAPAAARLSPARQERKGQVKHSLASTPLLFFANAGLRPSGGNAKRTKQLDFFTEKAPLNSQRIPAKICLGIYS